LNDGYPRLRAHNAPARFEGVDLTTIEPHERPGLPALPLRYASGQRGLSGTAPNGGPRVGRPRRVRDGTAGWRQATHPLSGTGTTTIGFMLGIAPSLNRQPAVRAIC